MDEITIDICLQSLQDQGYLELHVAGIYDEMEGIPSSYSLTIKAKQYLKDNNLIPNRRSS
jgi:hypothetical protein